MLASALATCLALSIAAVSPATEPQNEQIEPPPHQVVASYFHRTVRCPTCKRIGGMAEEAVKKGFGKEVKTREIEFHLIDFQDDKNAKLAKAYGVESPTLVLANVFDEKTVCWTAMPRVWQLVAKPEDFRSYVQDGVARYLKQTKEEAQKEREKSKESKE